MARIDANLPLQIAALDASIGRIVLKKSDFRFDHNYRGRRGCSKNFG
jgi:hypothetical protein